MTTALDSTRPGADAAATRLPRPSIPRLVAVELRKALDTTVSRVLVLVGVLVLAGALAITLVVAEPEGWGLRPFTTTANGVLGTALALLGILLVTGEFGQRTMSGTLSLVPSRGRVVAVKSLAAVILAVAGFAVALGVAAVATGIGAALEPDVPFTIGAAAIGQMLLISVISVLIGVAFGLLFQNTVVAVLLYLLLPQVVSALGLIPGADSVTPWVDINAAGAVFGTGEVESSRDWAQLAVATVVWVGLPGALGTARFLRREIR